MRTPLIVTALAFSGVVLAQSKVKIVILQPTSRVVLAGQKESTTVFEAAARVVPKIEQLSKDTSGPTLLSITTRA